jgi:hypothetical protein
MQVRQVEVWQISFIRGISWRIVTRHRSLAARLEHARDNGPLYPAARGIAAAGRIEHTQHPDNNRNDTHENEARIFLHPTNGIYYEIEI